MPKGRIDIQEDWCKSCGLCVAACKTGSLRLSERINPRGYHTVTLAEPEKCTGCAACALVCPDAAIEVYCKKMLGLERKN